MEARPGPGKGSRFQTLTILMNLWIRIFLWAVRTFTSSSIVLADLWISYLHGKLTSTPAGFEGGPVPLIYSEDKGETFHHVVSQLALTQGLDRRIRIHRYAREHCG